MRRKPEVLILVLIAVLFSFTAAQATAPTAKEIPDIRNAINGAGVTGATLLDLEQYVIDPDDRTPDGLQDNSTLIWGENSTSGDDNVSVAANELQVNVPAGLSPVSGQSTFVVTDKDSDQDFAGPVTVKTSTLIAAPLVDDYLTIGGTANSAVPYTWALNAGQTARVEPGSQPPGGGRLFINHSSGTGVSNFYGASTILDASGQNQPRHPNTSSPVTLHGLAFGSGSSATLNTANISTDAGLNGSFIQALAGFSNWARVTVTRKYDDGSTDSYTVAIADSLEGSATDLDGIAFTGVPSVAGLAGSENFEGITVQDFIGQPNSAAYDADQATGVGTANTSRTAQTTTWDVRPLNTTPGGPKMANLDITSTGKPAPTFPGATDGRALKMTFSRQDGEGIIAFHKGIPPASYSPGDVVTFSMSVYVNLKYDGVNDDNINDGQNGLIIAMALGDALTYSNGNFNYIDFPISAAGVAAQQGASVPGATHYTNKAALLHGKWTRHQVSWRVPEIGQSVTGGPAGTGDLIDPTGLGAAWTIQRGDTSVPVLDQEVWVDNLSISRCPGPLCYALGASQVPMISAGFSFEFPNGNGTQSTFYPTNFAQPASMARGAEINGNFSTNNGTAALSYPALSPSTYFRVQQNAAAGWVDPQANGDVNQGGNTGAVYIGQGGAGVALRFPIDAEEALVLDSIVASAGGGVTRSYTPFLDMALIDQAINPGLHVNTAAFAGGSGGGPETLNQIVNNVSGIYGVRFSVRADGANPAANPAVNLVLCNADVTNGLVSQVGAAMLPNGADSAGSGLVWADYFLEGNVISFHSPQKKAVGTSGTSAIAASLTADNPGSQMAQIQIIRGPYAGGFAGLVFTGQGNGYEAYLGEVTGVGTPAQQAAAPGAAGQADVFVDEVGLYTVRDTGAYYDEDLTRTGLLP